MAGSFETLATKQDLRALTRATKHDLRELEVRLTLLSAARSASAWWPSRRW